MGVPFLIRCLTAHGTHEVDSMHQ